MQSLMQSSNLYTAMQYAFKVLFIIEWGWCKYRFVKTVWASEWPSNQETIQAMVASMIPMISDGSRLSIFNLPHWKYNIH